jgi:hypothetical protein
MRQEIRTHRRRIYRIPHERYAWSTVNRTQLNCALRGLVGIYRRAGA